MGANPNGKLAEHNNALMLISPLAEDNWMLKRGGYHNHYFFFAPAPLQTTIQEVPTRTWLDFSAVDLF